MVQSASPHQTPRRRTVAHDRFLALAHESADVFWLLSPTGMMQEIFPSWSTFTGQERGQSLGQGWRDAVHPADQPHLEALLLQAVTSGHPAERECHLRCSDGVYHLLHLRAIPVRKLSGMIREVIVCGNDLARQDGAEQMSEEQVQLAAHASQVGLWGIDQVTKQAVCTPQQKALFGWSPDASGSIEHFLATLHPEDYERLKNHVEWVRNQDTAFEMEYRTIWPDGSIHWITARGQTLFDPQDRPTQTVGACFDITKLKEAEADLQVANTQIRTILESISDAFMYLDMQWRYIYVNQRMGEIIGRNPAELPGRILWETVPELRGTVFEHHYRDAMKTQRVVQFEGRHPTFQRWLTVHVYPSKAGMAVYLQDITERRQAEEALRESEARFRALVESNLIGITIADQHGTIHEANDAFLSLIGYTREDLSAGRIQWTTLTPPEYQERDIQALKELRITGVARPFEKAYVTKGGERVPVLLGGTLVRQENAPSLILAFIVDLTANKELDRQKDLALGITSHELKTPLCALKGLLQLVQRRARHLCATTPPALETRTFCDDLLRWVWACTRQVDVQTHLINDLLDVSRITAQTLTLELAPCDLVAIVRETVEDVQMIAPERQLLLTLPEHTTVQVLADATRISQVVTNYVTNALRYSSSSQPVQIGLNLLENRARVWVQDHGPGLSEAACKAVWQRYHQVKGVPVQSGSGKGLGLGLYICQTLIAQHQGEVGVESAPGEGSTFWFSLPMISEADPA